MSRPMVSAGGRCARTPSKMGECPFVPRSPALRLAPAVPGTAPTELACLCPWSREGKNGEGLSLLKAHSVFVPKRQLPEPSGSCALQLERARARRGLCPGPGSAPRRGKRNPTPMRSKV